jgi:hypothetical protein
MYTMIRCEKCDVEVTRVGWSQHLKTGKHMENDPNQTIKPLGHTRLCEVCNVNVNRGGWDFHIKSERHLTGIPDKTKKVCKICNLEVTYYNSHLRSKSHLRNNPSEIVEPAKPKNQ